MFRKCNLNIKNYVILVLKATCSAAEKAVRLDSLLAEKLDAEMVGLTAAASEFLRAELKVLY